MDSIRSMSAWCSSIASRAGSTAWRFRSRQRERAKSRKHVSIPTVDARTAQYKHLLQTPQNQSPYLPTCPPASTLPPVLHPTPFPSLPSPRPTRLKPPSSPPPGKPPTEPTPPYKHEPQPPRSGSFGSIVEKRPSRVLVFPTHPLPPIRPLPPAGRPPTRTASRPPTHRLRPGADHPQIG